MDMLVKNQLNAVVELARRNLAQYDARDGLAGNPDWDLVQAAKMAENIRQLLALIELA